MVQDSSELCERQLNTRASPSQRRRLRTPPPATSTPSDKLSHACSIGWPPALMFIRNPHFGSRWSIHMTPLSTAAAPDRSVLACRFRIHSPLKSGLIMLPHRHEPLLLRLEFAMA